MNRRVIIIFPIFPAAAVIQDKMPEQMKFP